MTLQAQAAGTASKIGLAVDEPPVASRRAPTKVTASLRREVLERYELGQASRQIARELEIAKATVLKIVARDGQLRPRAAVLTPEQVEEARRLRAEGLLYREIAERFGVHKETIRRRLLS